MFKRIIDLKTFTSGNVYLSSSALIKAHTSTLVGLGVKINKNVREDMDKKTKPELQAVFKLDTPYKLILAQNKKIFSLSEKGELKVLLHNDSDQDILLRVSEKIGYIYIEEALFNKFAQKDFCLKSTIKENRR